MAKSKKIRKKGKTVRHGLRTAVNQRFWYPIHLGILAQCKHPSIAAVSTDLIEDRLLDAILDPIQEAIDDLKKGDASFYSFWVITQGIYLYSLSLGYVVTQENFAFKEQYAQDYWLNKHKELLNEAEDSIQYVVQEIGERHKRTGKYGVSGDEVRLLETFYKNFEELLDWGSIRMIYHASKECTKRVEQLESKYRTKE